MDVGSEISSKIRSAIKAKLVELGAYVDDELPDYVMIMVANKKSKFQMSEDLGLFLNANTDKFTNWLHGLLHKLQSITSDIANVENVDKQSMGKDNNGISSKSRKIYLSDDCNKKKDNSSNNSTILSCESNNKSAVNPQKDSLHKKFSSPRQFDATRECINNEQDKKAVSSLKSDSTQHSPRIDGINIPLSIQSCREDKKSTGEKIQFQNPVIQRLEDKTDSTNFATSKQNALLSNTSDVRPGVKQIDNRETALPEIVSTEVDKFAEELEAEHNIANQMESGDTETQLTSQIINLCEDENEYVQECNITSHSEAEDSEIQTQRQIITISEDETNDCSDDFDVPCQSRSLIIDSDCMPHSIKSAKSIIGEKTDQLTFGHTPNPSYTDRSRFIEESSRNTRVVEKRQSTEFHKYDSQIQKRLGPVSFVGSVCLDNEDDDTGYDPHNPAVGSVASVVTVTARKSSVPPSMQANKSLVLKAISEAEKSVVSKRRVAVTYVRPFMRSDYQNRDRDSDEYRRLKSSSIGSLENVGGVRLAQAGLQGVIEQASSTAPKPALPVYTPTRKVQSSAHNDVKVIGLVSRSKRLAAEQLDWTGGNHPPPKHARLGSAQDTSATAGFGQADTGKPQSLHMPIDLSGIKKEPASSRSDNCGGGGAVVSLPAVSGSLGNQIDCRLVEFDQEKRQSEERKPEVYSRGVPVLLDELDQEDFTLDLDVEQGDLHGVTEGADDNTSFVVTLDGVDPDKVRSDACESGSVDVFPGVSPDTPGRFEVEDKEDLSRSKSPPKIAPLNISLKDSDDDLDEAGDADELLEAGCHSLERCKFWPSCLNGSSCSYHHPNAPCKTFPHCKFGDKCLFIHPNCKFDAKCLRSDCPFTHSTRQGISHPFKLAPSVPVFRPPAPTVAVPPLASGSVPQCKFFPACTNVRCPFFHPKPCRFGATCKTRGQTCPFFHPAVPAKHNLSWSAPKTDSDMEAVSVNEGDPP